MVKLAPSLACVDLLHVGDVVRDFERNGIDYIHFDISDTTFCKTIMLPMGLIPQLKAFTKLPLDIHIMTKHPEDMVDAIKGPLDGNDIISVQIEGTTELSNCLLKAKEVCRCGAVLNMATPVSTLEYVAELLDMVVLIQGNGGAGPRHYFPEIISRKIKDVRQLLHKYGNDRCLISVDGNVTYEAAQIFQKNGADVLVLGTRTLFMKDTDFSDNVKKIRDLLKE